MSSHQHAHNRTIILFLHSLSLSVWEESVLFFFFLNVLLSVLKPEIHGFSPHSIVSALPLTWMSLHSIKWCLVEEKPQPFGWIEVSPKWLCPKFSLCNWEFVNVSLLCIKLFLCVLIILWYLYPSCSRTLPGADSEFVLQLISRLISHSKNGPWLLELQVGPGIKG